MKINTFFSKKLRTSQSADFDPSNAELKVSEAKPPFVESNLLSSPGIRILAMQA